MKPKVRIITTLEGRFLNLTDMKAALMDDSLMEECLVMLAVGHQLKHPQTEMMRRAISCAIARMAGDLTEEGFLKR